MLENPSIEKTTCRNTESTTTEVAVLVAKLSEKELSNLFDVTTGYDILSGTIPELKWYVPKFILKGYHTCIYGAGGCGKTTLMIYLALCFVTGKQTFLGETIQANVLFLNEEMSDTGFQLKMKQIAKTINIKPDDVKHSFFALHVQGWTWDSLRHLEWLEWYCKTNKINVVIVDSLLSTCTGDITTGQQILNLKRLLKWGYRHNITFIYTHHTNKEGTGKIANAKTMYGSIIIDQTFDHTYGLNRYGNKLVIRQDKARWVAQEEKLDINVPIDGVGGYQRPYQSQGYQYIEAILSLFEISDETQLRFKDFKTALVREKPDIKKGFMSEPSLVKYLTHCVDHKLLVKNAGGFYEIY